MTTYLASWYTPGYLPHASQNAEFGSVQEAWAHLARLRGQAERTDGGRSMGTPSPMTKVADRWEQAQEVLELLTALGDHGLSVGSDWLRLFRLRSDGTGTLYGTTPGYARDVAPELRRNYIDQGIAYKVQALRRPGRPEVGPAVNLRLPAELLASLDERAVSEGVTRAEMVRRILAAAL